MPAGYTNQSVMIPMRDGVKLATEIFLPPGDKPACVILVRTPYGRFRAATYAKEMLAKKAFVWVTQDARANPNSVVKVEDPVNNENEIQDSYDTLEWISKQPWCNGRVGMLGGSGHGMCAAMAYLCKHPSLVVVAPSSSAGHTYLYWSFENGVRRWMYNWLSSRGLKTDPWPRPTLYEKFDSKRWQALLDEAAKDNKTVYLGNDGWFNIFGDYTLDFFAQFAPTGRVQMLMDARIHGSPGKNIKFKIKESADKPTEPILSVSNFLDVLEGTKSPSESNLTYAVIGDYTDPGAPGNIMRNTETWPPASTPVSFYFTRDGGLKKEAPSQINADVSYTYNPKDPAPTIGCCYSFGDQLNGAYDQRPLAERKDVIRFVSGPLPEPLEIAGKLRTELFVSSDVPDTAFIVKFVDIYPDGQEIILREAAVLARYIDLTTHDASPLKKG